MRKRYHRLFFQLPARHSIAWYASLSVHQFVGPLVQETSHFRLLQTAFISLLLPKYWWAYFITAPAHSFATYVALSPAFSPLKQLTHFSKGYSSGCSPKLNVKGLLQVGWLSSHLALISHLGHVAIRCAIVNTKYVTFLLVIRACPRFSIKSVDQSGGGVGVRGE